MKATKIKETKDEAQQQTEQSAQLIKEEDVKQQDLTVKDSLLYAADELHESSSDNNEEEEEEENHDYPSNTAMHSMFGSTKRTDYPSLLSLLKSTNPDTKLIALQELCEILSISSEETYMAMGGPKAMGFNVQDFVACLLGIVKGKAQDADVELDGFGIPVDVAQLDPEAILLSCRCLANLIEAFPLSISIIVSHGAFGVLVEKIKAIEYIDLAEQIMSVLEKLAMDFPEKGLAADILKASTQYIDFFNIHVQRSSMAVVANSCRGLKSFCRADGGKEKALAMLDETMPILVNLLGYSDAKLVEKVVSCIFGIFDWAVQNEASIQACIKDDLVFALFKLLDATYNQETTTSQIINCISLIVKKAPTLSADIIVKFDGLPIIYKALTGREYIKSLDEVSPAVANEVFGRPSKQLTRILDLILAFLPSLDVEAGFAQRAEQRQREAKDIWTARISDNLQAYRSLGIVFVSLFVELFCSTVDLKIRLVLLDFFIRVFDNVQFEASDTPAFSSSISRLLSDILSLRRYIVELEQKDSKDTQKLASAAYIHGGLFLFKVLLEKQDEAFATLFLREGLTEEVEAINIVLSKSMLTLAVNNEVAKTVVANSETVASDADSSALPVGEDVYQMMER